MKRQVSVVIPLYNKERYVARAVGSVLNQTHGDLELIVVDDGSTDRGAQQVKAVQDPRIRLVGQTNAGVSAARNRGIAEARADVVAFLDADDEWLPDHLATILRLAEKHPECGAYATTTAVVEQHGIRIVPSHDGIPPSPWEGVIPSFFRSADTYPVSASAIAVPRRIFDSVGRFPEGVQIGEDIDMWCRIALRYPIAYSTQVGAVYHKEADNRALMIPNRVPRRGGFVEVIQDALRTGVIPVGQRWDAFEYVAVRQIEAASYDLMSGDARCARRLLQSCRQTKRYARSWRWLMLLTMLPPNWPSRLMTLRQAMFRFGGRGE